MMDLHAQQRGFPLQHPDQHDVFGADFASRERCVRNERGTRLIACGVPQREPRLGAHAFIERAVHGQLCGLVPELDDVHAPGLRAALDLDAGTLRRARVRGRKVCGPAGWARTGATRSSAWGVRAAAKADAPEMGPGLQVWRLGETEKRGGALVLLQKMGGTSVLAGSKFGQFS
jgi:hypothetical protein